MNKMGKRFIALLVIFTSIISFLPMKFGINGQAVQAAAGTAITVTGLSSSGERVDSSKAPTYSTQKQFSNFEITVEDQYKDPSVIKIGETAIVKQELIIKEINRMKIDEQTNASSNLSAIGTSIENINRVGGRVGKRINSLPLGVNEIIYSIKTTTVKRIQDPSNPDDKVGILTAEETLEESPQIIKIEHANGFVQDQVKYVDFTSYAGGRVDSDPTSNSKPFKYTSRLYSEKGKALKFEYEVPNSVTDLDYNIYFPNGVDTNATTTPDLVFVNGSIGTGIAGSGNELRGTLQKTADSTLLVIAIRHPGALQYSYSIEINYKDKQADDDYSFNSPGITKYNYENDSSVKAYIGKEFRLSEEIIDVPTYNGTLNVDKKAGMLNFDPILARDKKKTAYEVRNYYRDKNGVAKIKESEFKNNKQYIDFAAGETSNQIYIEIYEGENGNKTGALLGRYILDVKFVEGGGEAFNMNLIFSNVDGTTNDVYLAQRGTPNIIDPFNIAKRNYDLHSGDTVKITLEGRTSSNEYLKVWLGENEYSSAVNEDKESYENEFNVSDGTRASSLNIDLKKYQKMIVQAYYDEVKDNDDGTKTLIASHSLGEKYVFYIYKNLDDPDNPDNPSSNNASLNNLKISNGTLKTIGGSTGFESDVYDYKVTVPKEDTSSKITATATNSDVKSITATVEETSDEYELTSGEEFAIPLNSTGTTTLKIVVTAQDGKTTKTYNVVIKNDTRGSSANLKNVFLNVGDYTFDPDKKTTKVRVDQKVTSIKVTPIPEDPKAKVTVDGSKFSGSPITVSLKGSQQTDIDIEVTAEDGSDSNTYTLKVYRSDSDLDFDDDDDDDDDDDIFYDEFDECWVDISKYEEWGKVNGKDVYFNNKGRQVKNAWINTNGIYYYLGSKGYKETGWRSESDGKRYYLDPSTGEMKKGWIYQNNTWYYLGLNGVMKTGWLYLNNKWYYFTPNGEMIANQSMYIDGKVYRFAQDGTIY